MFSNLMMFLVVLTFGSGLAAAQTARNVDGTDVSRIATSLKLNKLKLSPSGEGGAGSTGGGDEKGLLQNLQSNEVPTPLTTDEQIKDFVRHARLGLSELEKYSRIGWTFEGDLKLTSDDIIAARKIIDDLESETNGKRFLVDDSLVNPETGEPRLAQNSLAGNFTLNSKEWALLETKYASSAADRIRTVVAVHEVLQQNPIRKEGTGNFAISSQLLKMVPNNTGPMDLGKVSLPGIRVDMRRGLVAQATCNTRTFEGDAQIKEFRKESDKKNAKSTLMLTWFKVRNADLCKPAGGAVPPGEFRLFSSAPLMDLAFSSMFGVPSVTLFALACTGASEETCGIADFQTLPGESIDPYLTNLNGQWIQNDYR